MGILIGADFVPTNTNEKYFIKADSDYLFGTELKELLSKADYKIFNLEIPLTNKETPIRKCGPNLIAKTDSINLFKKIGVDLFTIANNHILDQGKEGLESTMKILSLHDIGYVGAGNCLEEATQPVSFGYNGKKIGVYACAEHEFSIATKESAGVNPFNLLNSFDDVIELKKKNDYVIVLFHGGKEHYRYPSPDLQKYCRKFIDKGANLVVCQHSHCIGCKEEYKNGTIVYGQGNFLFDDCEDECWQTSLILDVIPGKKIEYIPLIKMKDKVRLARGEKRDEIIQNFEIRSEEIKEIDFVAKKYQRFANEMLDEYLWVFCGANKSLFFRMINKMSNYRFYKWYVKKKFNKQTLLMISNYIECEAHRELLLRGLKKGSK